MNNEIKFKQMNNKECRIFLVDDDPFCRSIYREHLSNLGFSDITDFENGVDCLSNLDKNPDIIFLDHGMGQLTGLEVLRRIKKSSQAVSVVFLSGEASLMTAVNALKAGAAEYIVKGRNDLANIAKIVASLAPRLEAHPGN
jgi:polysaccharide export outer membrane protein